MKNKFLLIVISIMLSLSASVWAADDVQMSETEPAVVEEVIEDVQNILQQEDEKILEMPAAETDKPNLPYKQPISKGRLVKKFLLAMFAVGVSSVVLYFGLTIYNRLRNGMSVRVKTPGGETPLSTPVDIESAAQTFLDKTKWD